MALTRRGWIKASAGTALLQRNARAAKPPNIVFLLTDDQRFDTLGALGHPEVKTPNLDRLVRAGTTFNRASIMGSTVPAVCIPSRSMMLTGQYLFGAHSSVMAPQPTRPFHLYPELLREAGYAAFGTGKWHNAPKLFNRCFDDGENVFFGGMSDQLRVQVSSYDRSSAYPKENQRTGEKFSSELFSDSAIRFLKSQKGQKPFLLYVAYTSPHDPRMAPAQYARMYDPAKVKLPPNFLPQHPFDNGEMKVRDEALAPWPRTPEEIRRHIAGYYAMVSEVDAQIGRVLVAIEDSGQAANTIVIYTGDNGLAVGQHGLMGKQNLYDHSMRVPLVMRGPGVPANRRNGSLCYLPDLCPTILDMAGVPKPSTVEGESLMPLLAGRKRTIRDSVMAAYRDVQRSVRTETHKLIEYNVAGKRTTQLFDLGRDPWEIDNRAEKDPRRVEQLRGLLRAWMKRAGDPLDLDRPGWK